MTEKIKMKNPVVEIDGDEMTRVMWRWVKERLLFPYVELKTEYYDLGLSNRDKTEDRVTFEAANAIKKWGIGVKCATITPNKERIREYNLKKEWPSPNATIRRELDGTVFRAPIIVNSVKPAIRFWKKPIIVARHAFGDIYDSTSLRFDSPGQAEVVFKSKDGKEIRAKMPEFKSSGVLQSIYNIDDSIVGFARASFRYALSVKLDLWFSAKDTISKVYDARFKEIFNDIYENEFKEEFAKAGINYNYYLIDDAVARIVRSEGGMVWACKNYDGDVFSDFVSTAFVGSLALMTSELMSPHGYYLSEAAHGTVQRHYYRYIKGEKVSSNPTALIFAWSRALKRRGEIDGTPELVNFSNALEKAVIKTIDEDRIVTQDIARITDPPMDNFVYTQDFIDAIAENLNSLIH